MAGGEPGWYLDNEPGAPARQRYWDGEGWTDHTREVDLKQKPSKEEQLSAGQWEEPKPLRTRARVAIALLVLTVPIELWLIFTELDYIGTMNRVLDGRFVAAADLKSAERAVTDAGTAQGLIFFATVIAFLCWFARAYYNLPRLRVYPLRFDRGWSWGAWLVPILNLFRPKAIANDIWRGSDAAVRQEAFSDWKKQPVPVVLHLWWGAWLLTDILSRYVFRAFVNNDNDGPFRTQRAAFEALREERTTSWVDIAASASTILAALLAIMVIMRLTQRQEEAGVPT